VIAAVAVLAIAGGAAAWLARGNHQESPAAVAPHDTPATASLFEWPINPGVAAPTESADTARTRSRDAAPKTGDVTVALAKDRPSNPRPARKTPEPAPVEPEANRKPAEPRVETRSDSLPVASASRPKVTHAAPARVETGTLSVFFLGGVGELRVNGKKFAHQPPFEGVSMPAGTYRIACRMTGDDAPREVMVTIRADAETVLEYEMGGTPVVTQSPSVK
jgi:hypothetical protein